MYCDGETDEKWHTRSVSRPTAPEKQTNYKAQLEGWRKIPISLTIAESTLRHNEYNGLFSSINQDGPSFCMRWAQSTAVESGPSDSILFRIA